MRCDKEQRRQPVYTARMVNLALVVMNVFSVTSVRKAQGEIFATPPACIVLLAEITLMTGASKISATSLHPCIDPLRVKNTMHISSFKGATSHRIIYTRNGGRRGLTHVTDPAFSAFGSG